MQSIWIRSEQEKGSFFTDLPLPIHLLASADAMWTSANDRPQSIPASGIKCFRLGETGWLDHHENRLIFVLIGSLEFRTDSGELLSLFPGDVALVEEAGSKNGKWGFSDDCHIFNLAVPHWTPQGVTVTESAPRPSARTPNFKWLYTGEDQQAYFRDFSDIFSSGGSWGPAGKPVKAIMFIELPSGFFMDWHPEGANNLVVVLDGELELESAGGGKDVQIFRPGDVCMAVDRTGQGHIDRMRGRTRLATIVVSSKDI